MKIVSSFRVAAQFVSGSLLFCLVVLSANAQSFKTNSRLLLGTEKGKSASVRLGDLDGDKDLDVVVANGRHWPGLNLMFFNDGRSRFTVKRPVGLDSSTTYACELADLDGDGDLDIATGNDRAPCQIFLNNGAGRFSRKGSFGKVSSVRSLTIADMDRDGDKDILVTCRGSSNWIYLNDGKAGFDTGIEFGTSTDSTIAVAVGDVNGNGFPDLILANRDGQPNALLLNNGKLRFSKANAFGNPKSQSRAVVVGDFNGDQKLDWAIGNIGQPNRVFLGDGKGGTQREIEFGLKSSRTYCLAATDIDLDGDLDLVAGNAGQTNSVFFNNGDASVFREENFGDETNATYGLCLGDLNGDQLPDIAVANSDAMNSVFLNQLPRNPKKTLDSNQARISLQDSDPTSNPESTAKFKSRKEYQTSNWPAFRGLGGRGVAEGFKLPSTWNADSKSGNLQNVLWQADVPGLGHSSPVIQGEKLFLLTAVASDGNAPLQVESGGKPTAADDHGVQECLLLCYQKSSGKELWRRTLQKGKPRATRHAKATHANSSVFCLDDRIVAFLGSEGLYCYDSNGSRLWKKDLGVINISKYGIGWGFSSSPVAHSNRVIVVCDDPSNPFLAAFRLQDGEEIWRTSRKGVCERSWGTPLVHSNGQVTQAVVNGWPWIVSYNVINGKEIWRLKGGGDNPVPTPFEAHGRFYITNAHGGSSPIYAVDPKARGNLSSTLEGKSDQKKDSSAIAWHIKQGGAYMSTPVVYGDQIYVGTAKGVIRSFNATNGQKVYEARLGNRAGIIASLVAGDEKIYCASENGVVYVIKHGLNLEFVAKNQMGDPCLATPAISAGTIFFRTTKKLIAVGQSKSYESQQK